MTDQAANAMREELALVLQDPGFARSPVLSRLLTYLVEQSIKGEGANLKSYTVAVEGLGRDPDFDPQVDSYSRVLAGRLRRNLDAYYRAAGAGRRQRLSIAQGTYEVHLEPNASVPEAAPHAAPDVQVPGEVSRWRSPTWPWWLAGLAAALILAGIAWWAVRSDQAAAQRWRANDFPAVLIRIDDRGAPASGAELNGLADAIGATARGYESIRLADRMSAEISYVIQIDVLKDPAGRRLRVLVTNLPRNRSLYSTELTLGAGSEPSDEDLYRIRRLVYSLISHTGVITAFEKRNRFTVDSPYDCWLQFSRNAIEDRLLPDPKLAGCAATWHRQAPEHPTAAALHAWSLIDGVIGFPVSAGTAKDLDEAVRILEKAHVANPTSRHVLLALARSYAVMGDRASLAAVVRDSGAAITDNPDFANTIGTLQIIQGDPAGEALVDRSITMNADPPPRYFIGKFVTAMMREDLAGAEAALGRLTVQNHSGQWSRIFRAAYLARIGRVAEAKQAWSLATAERPVLRAFPQAALLASPAAPPVKQKLIAWLKPVIG